MGIAKAQKIQNLGDTWSPEPSGAMPKKEDMEKTVYAVSLLSQYRLR
jgi:hypothetical protein